MRVGHTRILYRELSEWDPGHLGSGFQGTLIPRLRCHRRSLQHITPETPSYIFTLLTKVYNFVFDLWTSPIALRLSKSRSPQGKRPLNLNSRTFSFRNFIALRYALMHITHLQLSDVGSLGLALYEALTNNKEEHCAALASGSVRFRLDHLYQSV